MTSSQSPEGDGIPTLASRVSCFVGSCLDAELPPILGLHCLHRHSLSASPAVASQSGSHRLHGSRKRQVERECTMVEHASAFTQANDLAWNLQTLFRCQSTRTIVSWLSSLLLNIQDLSTQSLRAACGQRSFLPPAEARRVSRTELR